MKQFSLILVFTFALCCVDIAIGQEPNVTLPTGVKNILNQNFPNWKVVDNGCQTAASGDFNGDRKTDYITLITYRNGGSLVGFVSNGNNFQQVVVESLTKQGAQTGSVSSLKKGELAFKDPSEDNSPSVRIKNDGFFWGECESDGAGVLIFKNNDFVSPFGDSDNNSGGNDNNNGTGVGVGGSNPRGECTGKTYTNVSSRSICFPNGDISFADEVVAFQKGEQFRENSISSNPDQSLGSPNTMENSTNSFYASAVGLRGTLIVKFTNNALIDVDGPDLYVFEVGDQAEPTKIEISKDGRNWVDIGRIEGGTREVDIAGKVRRGDEFYFVRLTDLGTNSKAPAGADIDAVGAIGTVQRNSNQIPRTPSEIRGGGSSNNSSGGSIDIGKEIMERIRNRGNNNSGGNNNNRDGNEFIVKGPNPWLDTGIDVTDGCVIELSSSGRVDVSAGYGSHDANGTEKFAVLDGYPVASKKRYGLAAQITSSRTNSRDKNRDAWAYSDGKVHTSRQNGRLWLVVNDDNPGDNSGEFRVRVKANCGGGNSGGNNSSGNNNSGGGTTYTDTRGVSTRYGLGDLSFADRVVSFKKGSPSNNGNVSNPDYSIGKPDYNEIRDEENYVTLGCAGVLTVEFVDNVLVDSDGADLYVYEIGNDVEPTKVEISKDGKTWINVGSVRGSTATLDIGSYVSPNDEFRFVRLTDLKSACGGGHPGADIDAIGAISSRRNDGGSATNNPSPVNNNPPPTTSGSRTVKLFFYKPKKGDTRCATNLVPVNRQISGSQSVLRESLNALFGDDDSGMDDYTTGLSLVNVSIANGIATIVVTGNQNSACASLFEEQVRKTAMQFPTVKEVRIEFSEQESFPQDEVARGLEVFNGYATNLAKPNYPSSARNARIGGAVEVKITVDGRGNVTSAQAISGAEALQAPAENAARSSKFSSSAFNKTGILVFNFVP